MKSTLIIGNGFDLDVGMKTAYQDYAESKWWPFKDARMIDGCETLAYTLKQRANLDKWFDVEESNYKNSIICQSLKDIKKMYRTCTEDFAKYILTKNLDIAKGIAMKMHYFEDSKLFKLYLNDAQILLANAMDYAINICGKISGNELDLKQLKLINNKPVLDNWIILEKQEAYLQNAFPKQILKEHFNMIVD